MGKDYEVFICSRCEKALLNNKDYVKNERDKLMDQDELQSEAERLCYIQGWKDALKVSIMCSQN